MRLDDDNGIPSQEFLDSCYAIVPVLGRMVTYSCYSYCSSSCSFLTLYPSAFSVTLIRKYFLSHSALVMCACHLSQINFLLPCPAFISAVIKLELGCLYLLPHVTVYYNFGNIQQLICLYPNKHICLSAWQQSRRQTQAFKFNFYSESSLKLSGRSSVHRCFKVVNKTGKAVRMESGPFTIILINPCAA